MCFVKRSTVINLIYSGQEVFSYIRTLGMKKLSTLTLDIRHYDTKHNNTKHNATQN
jgi:hypothetical protein